MVLFNNIPYKRMRLTSNVNLTKCFSKKYKHMHLITRLYRIVQNSGGENFGKCDETNVIHQYFTQSNSRFSTVASYILNT